MLTSKMKSLLTLCVLAVWMTTVSQAQDGCQTEVFPERIAYRTDNFEHQVIDNCTTYPNDATNTPGIDPTLYTQCSQPTTITDSNTGPPFYIWGENSGSLLLIFESFVDFSNITIYYSYNSTDGRPKLRIYAVPDNYEIWDSLNTSFPSMTYNEVSPGQGGDGIRQVPDETEESLQLSTSRVLIDKVDDTKFYRVVISEVVFQRFCPRVTGTEGTASTSTTDPQTTTTGDEGTTEPRTTVSSTTDIGDGSGQTGVCGSVYLILTVMALAMTVLV